MTVNRGKNPAQGTLYDLLSCRASDGATMADDPAFTFLGEGGHSSVSLTFRELHQQAIRVASQLRKITHIGDRVLLVLPPGMEYIVAFWGCLYAGVVAVPAVPPSNKNTLSRLQLIAQDSLPAIALTLTGVAQRMQKSPHHSQDMFSRLPWLLYEDLDQAEAQFMPPVLLPSEIAFLQYTSGSTGKPKAVMVSHGNIMANLGCIHVVFNMRPGDALVSWLPPYHDMGLIGFILYPVYGGSHAIHFSPATFLSNPYLWLKCLSDYRARVTAAPNFAYELCLDRITEQQKQTLNLAGLEFFLNGAEPVRPATLTRFIGSFSTCGLRPGAIVPVYGLAEATLLVSANISKEPGRSAGSLAVDKRLLNAGRVQPVPSGPDALDIVSTGPIALADQHDHCVAIVHPDSLERQPEDRVGEIWLRSQSVAQGYWNKPDVSQAVFRATMAGGEDTYLRTGDLGFLHAGELYITGRLKEMMIIHGQNRHYLKNLTYL